MALSDDQQNGIAYLTDLLSSYGLSSLSGWARDQVIAGNSPLMVAQLLQDTPEFKARFKVIFDRRAKGLSPMSVNDVINYEHQARQLFQSAGLPPGFYDSPDDFYSFMDNDISLNELSSRVDLAKTSIYSSDPTQRAEMKRLYGLSDGQELAYILDPNRALPLIQNQFISAQNAAAASRSGYGELTLAEAEHLTQLGIDPNKASQGFGSLVQSQQLFTPLPGQDASETPISRDTQLNAAFAGDAKAQDLIARRAEARAAQGKTGGTFIQDREGFAGLGTNNT